MNIARKLSLCFAALLILLCSSAARAQVTTATLNGQVTDQAGAAIADAEVTVTSISTREQRTIKSGDDGYYTLTNINPGIYDLTVKAQGFKELVNKNVELLVGDRKTLNISLEAGAV